MPLGFNPVPSSTGVPEMDYVKDTTETYFLDANIAPDGAGQSWPAVGIKSGFPSNHGNEKGIHDSEMIRMLSVGGWWAIWSLGLIRQGFSLAGVLSDHPARKIQAHWGKGK